LLVVATDHGIETVAASSGYRGGGAAGGCAG
jgi:hypothetical protein